MSELTFGEKAVGIRFNPGKNPDVNDAKETMAKAIDQMNNFRERSGLSAEHRRLASIAITHLQEAQMWMVKAITWEE